MSATWARRRAAFALLTLLTGLPLAAAPAAATPAPATAVPAAPATAAPRAAAPRSEGTQPGAPWPTMRHDTRNTGVSDLPADAPAGARPWSFATGRGIFSTPAIAADGTVYLGSADDRLYALDPATGAELWRFATGDIIDTAPALLAAGSGGHPDLVIGSGDEVLYRLRTAPDLSEAERVVWRFRPTLAPAEGQQLVNWWEGSPQVGPDGTIYDGNTGGGAYAVTSDGQQRWAYSAGNSVWTIPALAADGTTFWGSLDLAVRALDTTGQERWRRTTLGFVTSSPALSADGTTLYIGSFDGSLYALDAADGSVRWTYATADHIYASPALLEGVPGVADEVIVASADGTVTALGPGGEVRWSFDTGSPVRSSPAVGRAPAGQAGAIAYVGSSDGRLYALDAETGSLRWSFDTTSTDPELANRPQLNGSPALGTHGIVIGSQDGTVWSVPYDYCLRANDARCATGATMPDDGVLILPLDVGGTPLTDGSDLPLSPAGVIVARLLVRDAGRTIPAAMVPVPDASALVTLDPAVPFRAEVSGDGRTILVRPDRMLDPRTAYRVEVSGLYSVGGLRVGNVTIGAPELTPFRGGFTVRTTTAGTSLPLAAGTDAVTTMSISRLAVPVPAMLTSLNQIGFDFYDWIAGTVRVQDGRALLWVMGARRDAAGELVADPAAGFAFPLGGPTEGATFELGSPGVDLTFTFGPVPLQDFQLRGRFAPDGAVAPDAQFYAQAVCADVPGYGTLLPLTGMCNATGVLPVAGTFLGAVVPSPSGRRPEGLTVAGIGLEPPTDDDDGALTATLQVGQGASYPADGHAVTVLGYDEATGTPLALDYPGTAVEADAAGNVASVRVVIPAGTALPPRLGVTVMADVFPLQSDVLDTGTGSPAAAAMLSGGLSTGLLAAVIWLGRGLRRRPDDAAGA